MKKILSLLLLIIFLFSLAGCKNSNNKTSSLIDNTTSGFIDLDIVSPDENTSSDDTATDIEDTDGTESTDETNKNNDSEPSDDKTQNNNPGNTTNKNPSKPNDKNNSNNQTQTQNNNSANSKPSSNNKPNNNQTNNQTNNQQIDKPNNSVNNENNGEQTNNDNKPSTDDDKSKGYKDIECRSITEWKTVELVSNNNSLYLKVTIPNDWSITESGIIKIKNTQIGQISTKLTENFTKVYEEIKSLNAISPISASSTVREYAVNNEQKYKRIIKILKSTSSDNLLNLFISVDYSQINDNATSKILNSIINNGEYEVSPLLNKESTKDILFLGNNNISNSKIENFLSKMLNSGNKNQQVVTNQLVGGGEVNNFAANSGIISKISSGEYSVVVLNGFYTEENTIEPIKTIFDACKTSNTLLILFPAYDDNSDIVNTILSKYQEAFCINWKNEIEKLIATGTDGITSLTTNDFYSNTNESSTELSGYVGAHMIYRTIFDETPPIITTGLPENYTKIKDYFASGIIPGETKNEIFFIP